MSVGHWPCKYDCTGETPRLELGELRLPKESFDLVLCSGEGEGERRERPGQNFSGMVLRYVYIQVIKYTIVVT